MTTFLLIRHGENDFVGKRLVSWMPGVHLNARGREQAARLADRLAGLPVNAIYSSPLERARETAAPTATRLGLEVVICDALGEVRFGDWTGREVASLEQDPLWQRFNAQRSMVRIPGGEMMLEVQTRVVEALESIRAQHPDGLVAVFTHGDAIRGALCHYLGLPLDLLQRIEAGTASISTVRVADWGVQVLRINDTGELP